MTPSGEMLLVDSSFFGKPLAALRYRDPRFSRCRRSEREARELRDQRATREHAYVLYPGLFDIDVPARSVSEIDLPFVPQNINIAADDRSLYLRRDNNHVCVFDLATRRCLRELEYAPTVVSL